MIDKVLSEDEVYSLKRQHTSDDVIKALKNMKGSEAPEPNRLQTCFLHKTWNVLVLR